ncbi:D-3-phosphoglycerate dehydrogenase [Roseiarcus fermentans]|uniref:D-3-phosphoglycerate dehydrogenase n=1 Tax=Roseiarcus fermentans TaxID=1473586 RepID=A0A366FVQ5_9HYPH|nr:phosphoglycerate dehydrogenase [Roseiarcus fermentans]RBP18120.1 D-3-phosphoglycerate dehydrogenase [Roseiarcus fermentans]
MAGRIAITPRSISEGGHPALTVLSQRGYDLVFPAPGRQPTEDDLLRTIPACVGYLAGVEPISRAVISASPMLRVISRNGTGTDSIDVVAARERGVAIERATGANARGVAELALALMLDGLRQVTWSSETLKSGRWSRRKGRECRGRTVGIVGCGAIGRTFASLCQALEMTVIGHDPHFDGSGETLSFPLAPLDRLLAASDVVSLHCPATETPVLDAGAIARLRRGAMVVNTARAQLVDGAAMLSALESGQVFAFATDVFEQEPPEMSELLRHPSVILTPHAGGLTDESVERATMIAVDNLLRRLEDPGDGERRG